MDKHEKKRTKNKMAENYQRNGVRDPDRRSNRTCIRCNVIYLVACKVKGVRTLQGEIKEEHPYKPASFGRSEN